MRLWRRTTGRNTTSRCCRRRCFGRSARTARAPDLRRERLACGVDNEALDSIVAEATADHEGRVRIGGGSAIIHALLGEIATMLAPMADEPGQEFRVRYDALRQRAETLLPDVYVPADIDAMTSVSRERGDSLHLLVMDMHKALNRRSSHRFRCPRRRSRLRTSRPTDRPLIAAFMAACSETAPLKFDHPGLGTTATRSGARL